MPKIIKVKIIPRSSQNKIIEEEGYLKIKLTAPPVDGKANYALIAFLSKVLAVPKSKIKITKGENSRNKIIEIND